jgi:hypothetical protein
MSIRIFGLLVIVFAAIQTAHAAAILSTENAAGFPTDTVCLTTNAAACSGSALAPGTNWTLNYFAQSSANYGILRAEGDVAVTGDNSLGAYPYDGSALGFAAFQDTLTVTGGTGTGTLNLAFDVSGTSSITPGGSVDVLFQLLPVVGGNLDFAKATFVHLPASGPTIVPIAFTFGAPTGFQLGFVAEVDILTWQSGASAHADYFDTAILDGITVTDSLGNNVASFGITSESGTAYGPNGVVPEPASIYLVCGGFLVFGVGRRLRRA